jgi:hypothetical protein
VVIQQQWENGETGKIIMYIPRFKWRYEWFSNVLDNTHSHITLTPRIRMINVYSVEISLTL